MPPPAARAAVYIPWDAECSNDELAVADDLTLIRAFALPSNNGPPSDVAPPSERPVRRVRGTTADGPAV